MIQQDLINRANAVMPAGGLGNFDPSIIIREGKGTHVWDVDGNEYIDYLLGSGPMVLGHGHPEVLESVHQQLDNGMTFFANNPLGIELAEEICNAVPWRRSRNTDDCVGRASRRVLAHIFGPQ